MLTGAVGGEAGVEPVDTTMGSDVTEPAVFVAVRMIV
jgi:hypothetical protein